MVNRHAQRHEPLLSCRRAASAVGTSRHISRLRRGVFPDPPPVQCQLKQRQLLAEARRAAHGRHWCARATQTSASPSGGASESTSNRERHLACRRGGDGPTAGGTRWHRLKLVCGKHMNESRLERRLRCSDNPPAVFPGLFITSQPPASPSMSLHQIFNGGYPNEWIVAVGALSLARSRNCNRQGFNIQGQSTGSWQRDARIGIFFNNEKFSPDAGRNIGASSASAVVGCIGGCTRSVTSAFGCASRCSTSAASPFRRAATPPSPPPPACNARGYTNPDNECQNSKCSPWGVGGRCCGMTDGYCGEYTSTNPNEWISTSCGGLKFVRVTPGCGIEVETSGKWRPLAVHVLWRRAAAFNMPFAQLELRQTAICDHVQSIRLYALPPPRLTGSIVFGIWSCLFACILIAIAVRARNKQNPDVNSTGETVRLRPGRGRSR